MSVIVAGTLFAGGLLVGMLFFVELGRRIRQDHVARHGESIGEGLGAIEAAVFGLMGLLLAFMFSGAASRYDTRRQLLVDECNAISGAYQRLDLLQPDPRRDLQQRFRDYVDSRLAIYRVNLDPQRMPAALAQSTAVQDEIWTRSIRAVHAAPVPEIAELLLTGESEMFDRASTRLAATKIHPPMTIYALLGVVSLLCALLAGYGMGAGASRSWLHIVSFAAILAVTIYVIVNLEYPRLGLIRITDFDQLLVDVRASMR